MFDVEGLAAAVVDACYRFRHGRRGNDGMEEREIMAEALPLVLAGLRQREVRLPSPNPRSTRCVHAFLVYVVGWVVGSPLVAAGGEGACPFRAFASPLLLLAARHS
jgi:hypothetical protein